MTAIRAGRLALCLLFVPVFLSLTLATTSQAASRITWVGCGITKKAFMTEMAAAYKKKTGIEIDIAGGGATKGIRSTSSGDSDMGGSCRFRLDGETSATVRFNPVAWDALVAVVNKGNPVSDISLEQLRQVYLGKITNWKQLGGADRPINLLVRKGRISGVGLTIRQLMFNDPQMDFASRNQFPSSGPLEQAVEQDADAIAVTGISSARKRDFKILTLEGKSADYDNIRKGDYLLYRPLYLVTNSDSPNYSEVKKFLGFVHSGEGREIIRRNGTVPYLEAIALTRKQREQWKMARSQ